MTLFGVDISNNNDSGHNTVDINGINLENFSWVEAKVSEGADYRDPDWHRTRDLCNAKGIPVIGYHYVKTGDPDAQVRNWLANDGGANAMLDFEANSGDISNFWAVFDAFKRAGVTVRLSYIPHWYWQNIGAPDLSGVPGLVASNYVAGSGYAAQLYPGDNSARWFGYGGVTPAMLQFSSQAIVANLQMCDVNAFRGTVEQLRALLGYAPTHSNTGVFMALSDQQQEQLLSAVLDIQTQLRGPGLSGWPQLGQNAAGRNLTEVDALANIENELAQIRAALKAGNA